MNPFRLWVFREKKYMDDLFRASDQEGIPLADTLRMCQSKQIIPCLEQFVFDAIKGGWTAEKARSRIREACADSGYPLPDMFAPKK